MCAIQESIKADQCKAIFHFVIDSRTGFYLKKYGVEQNYLSAYHYTRNAANDAYRLVIFNPSIPYYHEVFLQ